jgi:hypothetical protein
VGDTRNTGARLDWAEFQAALAVDGSLRDIVVEGTSLVDWESLLTALFRWGYPLSWSVDGEGCPAFISAAEAFARRLDAGVLLKIDVGGIQVNTFFFAEDEIELDIQPREVSEANFGSLSLFLARVGDLLQRQVSITEESAHEWVLLLYDPRSQRLSLPGQDPQR